MHINTKLHKNKDGPFSRLAVNGCLHMLRVEHGYTIGRNGETFVSIQKTQEEIAKETRQTRHCAWFLLFLNRKIFQA